MKKNQRSGVLTVTATMYIKYLQVFLPKRAKNHSKGTTYVIENVTLKIIDRLVAKMTWFQKGKFVQLLFCTPINPDEAIHI